MLLKHRLPGKQSVIYEAACFFTCLLIIAFARTQQKLQVVNAVLHDEGMLHYIYGLSFSSKI
jgi:hypothetical protein